MHLKQITRIGVYGVVNKNGKMLVVRQKRGPFAGKLDFPGGGMEFGESPEEALRREFVEEVAMEFDSMQLIDNLTATVDVPEISSNEAYSFYQIGMIYQLDGCRFLNNQEHGDLEHLWTDLKTLSADECSKLLWKYRMTQ
jgi:mutator protein MutT